MTSTGMPTVEHYFAPALLSLLDEIYRKEATIATENDIYRCYALSGVAQIEIVADYSALSKFMRGLQRIMDDFAGSHISASLQSTKRRFSDALGDILAITEQRASELEINYCKRYLTEFIYLHAEGYDSDKVKARVAIHIAGPYVKNALRVVRALAAGLKISKGFGSLKVCAPCAIARTDHIIAYIYHPTDLGTIQALLTEGHVSDCLGDALPPLMRRVQTGVAFAEEPPNVPKSYVTTAEAGTIKNPAKYDPTVNPFNFTEEGIVLTNRQRISFGEFHTNRIWAGLVKWRANHASEKDQRFRRFLFLFEVYQAYHRKGVNPQQPHEFPDRANVEEKWFASYTFKNRI